MTTLIAVYNSDGCVGRCDAKCYDAKHPDCNCICHGKNHGAGQQQAMTNTSEMAQNWIKKWNQEHPESKFTFEIPGAQLALL